MQSSQSWQVWTLCGLACTGKDSGQPTAPLFFDTGPVDNQTLGKRDASRQLSITRDCGQMITAHSVSHLSATKQVMYLFLMLT